MFCAWCLQTEEGGLTGSEGEQAKRGRPFITTFSSCFFCSMDDEPRQHDSAECLSSYLEHSETAFCQFHGYRPSWFLCLPALQTSPPDAYIHTAVKVCMPRPGADLLCMLCALAQHAANM